MHTQQAEDGTRGPHCHQVAEQKGGNAATKARKDIDGSKCPVAQDSLDIWPDAEECIAVQAQVQKPGMQECAGQ